CVKLFMSPNDHFIEKDSKYVGNVSSIIYAKEGNLESKEIDITVDANALQKEMFLHAAIHKDESCSDFVTSRTIKLIKKKNAKPLKRNLLKDGDDSKPENVGDSFWIIPKISLNYVFLNEKILPSQVPTQISSCKLLLIIFNFSIDFDFYIDNGSYFPLFYLNNFWSAPSLYIQVDDAKK
ncbi:MAG: hypothetical protein MHPSP_000595, partial [Paramarteilia canceri]